MAGLNLQILGYGAAYPTLDRLTSSFLVKSDNHSYLVDCGEGTQLLFSSLSIKRKFIKAICITHMHGDHCFGLMGLISSLTHFQRHKTLVLIGPKALKEYVENTIKICQIRLSYSLRYITLGEGASGKVFEDEKIEIHTFPIKHRIQTQGYRFYEANKVANINKNVLKELDLSIDEIKKIKANQIVYREGKPIDTSKIITIDRPKSISICTDTIYDEDLIRYIKNSDLCYHEATYTKDLSKQARERMHATAEDAAKIAKLANVGQLVIGHFSSRYTNYSKLLEESQSIFPATIISKEGLEISL